MFLEIGCRTVSLECFANIRYFKFDIFFVWILVFRFCHKYAVGVNCVNFTYNMLYNVLICYIMCLDILAER